MSGFEILKDVTLGADSTTLDLSGLDLSGWYQVRVVCPKIRTVGQGAAAGDFDRCFYRLNDDSGANYIWGVRNYNDAYVTNDTVGYTNGIEGGHMVGPNIAANYWGSHIVDIINPGRNDIYKTVHLRDANLYLSGFPYCTWGPATWKSTSPITKISLMPNVVAESLKAGSRAFLLGMIPAGVPTPTAPGTFTLSVSDDFNRANGALGANWASQGEGGGSAPTIVSNQFVGNGNTTLAYWIGTSDPFPSNQFSEITLGTQGNPLASGKWVGVTVRQKDATHCYLGMYYNNSGTYELRMYDKNGAGSYAQLGASVTLPGALVAADRLRIEADGDAILIKVNDVVKMTRTDTHWPYGKPGIMCNILNTEQNINAWSAGTV